jgi:subtilisin family serine protease
MVRLGSRRTSAALIASWILVITAIAPVTAIAPQGDLTATPLTASERITADKAPTSRLAETDQELLARTDARSTSVMIKLDYDSIATYEGGIAGLAATSPRVTGRPLTGASAAERQYDAYARAQEAAFVAELQAAVPGASVDASLRIVYGGVAASIPASAVETVLGIPGAVAVQYNDLEQPLTDSSPEFVNAPPVYDILGTTSNAGAGIIYGNLDTGIWPEHPSFADQGNLGAPPAPARECNYGDNPLTPANDPFACQNKLIGGAHFTDLYDECAAAGQCTVDPYAGTARDGDGHGTHTSSTTAGNIVDEALVFGVDRGPLHGLAPGAWVMEYKVCGPDGCFDSDSAAAVARAIIDGVDVINFSISGGNVPFADPVELAFLDAYAAGVFVSASAGNDGPGAGTANHLSPWTTTVGASTQTREFATTLSLTADDGDTFTTDGASITAGAGPLPVVLAANVPGYTDPLCGAEPSSPTIFDGLIVACQRGTQARVWKGFVVFSGGGEGMVLYNASLADVETDNHWLPTIHLADGTDFKAFMESHTGVTGEFPAGEARDGQGDVMAAFSSRGPGDQFIKPDLTAPGVQILAGASPTPPAPDPVNGGSPPGQFFQAIAGTSMSSPHVAGAAALVRAVHPDWTPGQVRSALMTTAISEVVKEDTVTPADPFDMGAGRIDIGTAAFAPITFDESAANFAAMGNDPVQAVHLNIPSINAPVMPGRLTTTRVADNASGVRERFEAWGVAPNGSTITVLPRRFTVNPGQSVTLTITIESTAPMGAQQFGTVFLQSRSGHLLHLPVAFVHTQGSVNLVQSCSPATIHLNGQSRCVVEGQNNSPTEQVVDLDTFTTRGLRIIGTEGGASIVNNRHARLHNVTLAGFEPGVPSFTGGDSPAGYLPLDAFTDPIAIGDEEIINFNVPAFDYNGQSWNSIGVDSNGYLIVGGGSSEDNNCCSLPGGEDPARPNNILAPFWTDLDGTMDEGIFAVVLTDGTNDWIAIEWRVDVFGTTDQRKFQVWIGLNDDANPEQDISFTYSAPQTDPAGQDYLVGAENVEGAGQVDRLLPGPGDLVVTSSDAVPGDRVTYAVIVRGNQKGVSTVTSEMEASNSPGVVIVRTDIRVIK